MSIMAKLLEKLKIKQKEDESFLKKVDAESDISEKEETNLDKKEQEGEKEKSVSKKKELSPYEIERYAVMCNAHLEHQDEMEQYKND